MTELEKKLRRLVLKCLAAHNTKYTNIRDKGEFNPLPLCWTNLAALITKKGISFNSQKKLCTFFGLKCELVEIKNETI